MPFSWTGIYLGGNIGGAWSQRNVTDTVFGLTFDHTSSNARFIGGGQIGYNYQLGNVVLGVEGEGDWISSNNKNGAGILIPLVGTVGVTSNDKWLATAAARLGLTYDHWLFYWKAGGGWVGHDNFTVHNFTTGSTIVGTGNRTDSGFLVGVGIEYALSNNWTVKVEYDYLNLGTQTFLVPTNSPFLIGDTFANHTSNIQMAKVGFNYLFNMGGPAATAGY